MITYIVVAVHENTQIVVAPEELEAAMQQDMHELGQVEGRLPKDTMQLVLGELFKKKNPQDVS